MLNIRNRHSNIRFFILLGILITMSFGFTTPIAKKSASFIHSSSTIKTIVEEKMFLYESLELNALGLSRQAYEYALKGYDNLLKAGKIQKDNLLSILDFSLPSGKKRLFVLDIAQGEIVFNTYAAHGRNSGKMIATQFSNKTNSYKSSLGFYITGDVYKGKHGSSLRLVGEEKGINDNAMSRGIVMHSATYVDESIIEQQGFIGRSQGCPALPGNIYKEVIEKIKNGSCLFLYSPDKYYTTHSKILKERA